MRLVLCRVLPSVQLAALQERRSCRWIGYLSARLLLRRARSCLYLAVPSWLYIGNATAAMDSGRLCALGISHVLNAALELVPPHPATFVSHTVPLADLGRCDITPHLEPAFARLDACRVAGTAALVYCDNGCSRAVVIVIAYLVSRYRWPLYTAMRTLQRHASSQLAPCPTPMLRLQLALLEVDVFGYSTVAAVDDPLWDFPLWNCVKGTVPAPFPDQTLLPIRGRRV